MMKSADLSSHGLWKGILPRPRAWRWSSLVLVALWGLLLIGPGLVELAKSQEPTSPSDAKADPAEMAPEGDEPPTWHATQIPEGWAKQRDGMPASRGLAWYRCTVAVPESWRGEDLELFVEAIDRAHEVYFNGHRVGTAGSLPPNYRSGLGADPFGRVPQKWVRPGAVNLVAVRVFDDGQGRGGFNVAAPVLFGPKEAIRLKGSWLSRDGDDTNWARLDDLAASERKPAFDRLEDADTARRELKKLAGEEGPLKPETALDRFEIEEGLEIQQVLAEPDIGQPLSIKFDQRGRLWLVEYLQYPDPAGLTVVSRDRYLRTVYDKVPPPPPHHFRGRDRISIHEDTTGDGQYDRHTTFVDDLNIATSIALGRGGVWVLNPPYLLFYPDRDQDDRPDGDPEVHLEGFGLQDTHSVCNSLRWGPDGWLYAAQGSTVTGNVRRYGSEDEPVRSLGQLIWRYHPQSRRYEIFSEGGGNAFGVEIDAQGRIFSGHNGGNTRGFHYEQGAYLQKGFGKHGELSNPYAFGYFPAMAHHEVPRFTHTFIIYDGGALGQPYQGKLFGVEPLQGQIVKSEIQPDGSTFRTKDLSRPIQTSDTWFRPVDIKVGPDGALYVADLYEQRIDHASHFQGRVDRESGRVYRLSAKGAGPVRPFDVAGMSSDELLALLAHDNKWFRQTALRVIADRRDPQMIEPLKALLASQTGQTALEALWALNLCGGLSEEAAQAGLAHEDPFVRQWAVRLMCDGGEISAPLAAQLAELAAREPRIEVRSQLASSARRLTPEMALPVIRALLEHDADAEDARMPLLVWWAIESKLGEDADSTLAMFRDSAVWEMPLVKQHLLERVMRRFASTDQRKQYVYCAQLLQMAPSPDHVQRLMSGFEKAFQGRSLAGLPDELVAAMAASGGTSLALKVRQGDSQAIAEALRLIEDDTTDRETRQSYIEIFGQVRHQQSVPVLLKLIAESGDDPLRSAALSALSIYTDPQIGDEVVGRYVGFPPEVRGVAETLLASRRDWARKLLLAIDAGDIEAQRVPMPVVRKILFHDDPAIAELVKRHWGGVQGATTQQMRQRIDHLSQAILEGSGNPYQGKVLFAEHCGKCHKLFAQGGEIGPDLTVYQRTDLRRMLVNVVNPSAEIREGFENYLIITDSGRTLTGFIADRDNRVVVLKGIDGRSITIPRDEIDEMAAVARSVMPEGVLDPLSEQQIRDLFAYLRCEQPLP